jgi:hypothetical protein
MVLIDVGSFAFDLGAYPIDGAWSTGRTDRCPGPLIHGAGTRVDGGEEVNNMRRRFWAVLIGLTLVVLNTLPAFAEKSVIWGS